MGPPDFVVTGSATVLVNGKPAARMGDKTAHGGSIVGGSATVIIGGASAGATLGGVANATAACAAAAAGRTSGKPRQSYNNCGVESSRQIINQATGAKLTEDQLLNWAMNNESGFWNWLLGVPLADRKNTRKTSGGTTTEARGEILARHGIPSSQAPATLQNVAQAVAERRGVIVPLDASVLWRETVPRSARMRPGQWHAVVATGVEYDASGAVSAVIINDTGTGQCGVRVSAATMSSAMKARARPLNVTQNPVW